MSWFKTRPTARDKLVQGMLCELDSRLRYAEAQIQVLIRRNDHYHGGDNVILSIQDEVNDILKEMKGRQG
jgi:hypothetical protein